jgi:uncharacterized protein (TIGR02145 family)
MCDRKPFKLILSVITTFTVLFVCGCSSDDSSTNSDNPSVPILSTTTVSAITQTSAQSGGNITSDGGAAVSVRGVCWGTGNTPTIVDNVTTDGIGTGSFTSSLTGLTAGTPYYVRAYATNSVGTGYGNIQSFSTEAPATVTDIDGNSYNTVTIGSQVWMVENLKVTHYRNGDEIPNVTDGSTWNYLTTGAQCAYGNDANNVASYGRLYNWYAVDDSRGIAPQGWHVPTDEDWKQLEMYLGMSQADADLIGQRGTDEGDKLKEAGTSHWNSPNTGATNETGFSALPGGHRYSNGNFFNLGAYANFWSSTEGTSNYVLDRLLIVNYSGIARYQDDKRFGYSVRCVRD